MLIAVGCTLLAVEISRQLTTRKPSAAAKDESSAVEDRPAPDSPLWQIFDEQQPAYLISGLCVPLANATRIASERFRFFTSKVARANKSLVAATELMLQVRKKCVYVTIGSLAAIS
jgi:hypothetical protein